MQNSFLLAIDKWITEHGSAAIIKENLAFLRDKLSSADRELEAAEKERDRLKTELSECRQSSGAAYIELDDVKKQLEELRERYHGLKPIQVNILQALPEQEYIRLRDIASALQLSERQTLHHLVTLRDRHLITSPNYSSDPDWDTGSSIRDSAWRTTEHGLKYLEANGLLD